MMLHLCQKDERGAFGFEFRQMAMINASAGKTKRRVLFARPWRLKLDTFETHMTSFVTLNEEFAHSLHRWQSLCGLCPIPGRSAILFSNSTQEGIK